MGDSEDPDGRRFIILGWSGRGGPRQGTIVQSEGSL